jgi:hypothetical protein
MTKKVYIFGRNSLDKARLHVQKHHKQNLVLLQDTRGQIAVCSPHIAQKLRARGFQPISSGK